MCESPVNISMQERLPPHHVPSNVEAEPSQWFPSWVPGDTSVAPKGPQGRLDPMLASAQTTSLSRFYTQFRMGLYEIIGAATKLFSVFLSFHLEIISDFKNFKNRNSTLNWECPYPL